MVKIKPTDLKVGDWFSVFSYSSFVYIVTKEHHDIFNQSFEVKRLTEDYKRIEEFTMHLPKSHDTVYLQNHLNKQFIWDKELKEIFNE